MNLNDEVENHVSALVPEVVVVDVEENQQEQQQSEQQPMVMDEYRLENETPVQPPDTDFGKRSPDGSYPPYFIGWWVCLVTRPCTVSFNFSFHGIISLYKQLGVLPLLSS